MRGAFMLTVIIFLFGYFSNVIAMPKEEGYITPREDACFEWIHSLKDHCATAFNNLDLHTQTVLNSNIDSLEMDIAIHHYADKILKTIKERGLRIPKQYYTHPFVSEVMNKVKKAMVSPHVQKPVGPTTARLYAYKEMLTQEDHLSLQKNNYIANSVAGDAVLFKYAYAVVFLVQKYDKENKYKEYHKGLEETVNKIVQEKRESILKLYKLK